MDDLEADPRRIENASFGMRRALVKAGAFSLAFPFSRLWASKLGSAQTIKLGFLADLHQDLVQDGQERLESFLRVATEQKVDAIVQLGDFATPISKNRKLIETFNAAHPVPLHVIGNHDTDGGLKSAQVVEMWGMKSRFYSVEVNGLKLIALDGNDRPLNHQSGYPAHIADDQLEWLSGELKHPGPMIVLCHQPLAGPSCVDNAPTVQRLLAANADRIVVVINGHTHIDEFLEMERVRYWHVNSAAYYWVGSNFKHESYSREIHVKYPYLSSTCPYRDALFSFLEVDFETGRVTISGRDSAWVGANPAELGVANTANLESDKQIVPRIRSRQWMGR